MSTAHISAKKEEIAKTVVMAGDPLRAKAFANKYLTDVKLVNEVRGMYTYTGTTKNGKRVTVMGHGMGLNSIGIYAYELYKFYDVETIVRFGSCGSYNPKINVGDLIVAEHAWTLSNYGDGFGYEGVDTIQCQPETLQIAKEAIEETELSAPYYFTKVNASPWFYKETNKDVPEEMVAKGIDVVEMEAYALYAIANHLNKKALAILTVSDSLVTGEEMPPEQRQEGLTNMFAVLEKIIDKT